MRNKTKKLSLGSLCAKECHLDYFSKKLCNANASHSKFLSAVIRILFEFSLHSAIVYLAEMSSEESSDSEIPYDSSDEVWEKRE